MAVVVVAAAAAADSVVDFVVAVVGFAVPRSRVDRRTPSPRAAADRTETRAVTITIFPQSKIAFIIENTFNKITLDRQLPLSKYNLLIC